MECFDITDQKHIDEFLKGRSSEKDFLKKVKWKRRWGFPWEHYKPLIELAKQRRWRVLGLNARGRRELSLEQREKAAVARIAEESGHHPHNLIFVIYGDLHLSHQFMPQLIEQALGVRPLVIHQNSEDIYFKLMKKGLERKVNVVSLGPGRYCIINSAPWVRWANFWLHLEESAHPVWDDEEQIILDTFHSIAKFLMREIGVKYSLADIDVEMGPGFSYLPEEKSVTLERLQLNQVSAVAGLVVSSKLGAFSTLPHDTDVIRWTWLEAIAFFMSKLFNPSRPADTLSDIAREELDVFKVCLSQRRYELKVLQDSSSAADIYRPRLRSSYKKAAKKLGALLGEQLFWSYRSGAIRRTVLLKWLSSPIEDDHFEKKYFSILHRLSRWSYPMRTKEERL